MELAGPAPLCIETPKDRPRRDGLLTGLCQTHILGHCWEAHNGVWTTVPIGSLWMGVPHKWMYVWKLDWPFYLGVA